MGSNDARTQRTLGVLLLAAILLSAAPVSATVWLDWWGHVIGFRPSLVGHDLNGAEFNGEPLGEIQLLWVSLDDAAFDGAPMRSLELLGSTLEGIDADGKKQKKDALEGLELVGVLSDGGGAALRIDRVVAHPDKPQRDITLYEVSIAADEGWLPLCGEDDDGAPVAAVALAGWWDRSEGTATGGDHVPAPRTLTFACRGYVLAKCVEAGYAPWREAMRCAKGEGCTKASLADHHQACTRMLRADYCGDGSSHTRNGVPVNFYDALGIRTDDADWNMEAEWGAEGASCVADPRLSSAGASCLSWITEPDCGEAPTPAALLISEFDPEG